MVIHIPRTFREWSGGFGFLAHQFLADVPVQWIDLADKIWDVQKYSRV